MNTSEVYADAYGRIEGLVHRALDGLDEDTLTARLDEGGNSIAWLVWHLTRIQDDHLADVAGGEQVLTAGGFVERFGFPFDPHATGYGHRPGDVAQVSAPAALLREYFDAVHARTLSYLSGLSESDLDRIVDTRWDPPVTLGVRLVSVISDNLQHAGQALFVRGTIERA